MVLNESILRKDKMSFVQVYENEPYEDERGFLSKFVSLNETLQGKAFPTAEVFRSKTNIGFVRGMHFQNGDSSNTRLIHLMSGHIVTYFIDLRTESKTFGEIDRLETPPHISRTFFVPAGIAHGYYAIKDSEVLYLSDKAHVPNEDLGVNPLSEEFQWPSTPRGISKRDAALPTLRSYLDSITNR